MFSKDFKLLALSLLIYPSLLVAEPAPSTVSYGPHAQQVLDFYQAASTSPTPVMMFIHGGGWMNGDKKEVPLLKECLANGISVVSINYRLIPDAVQEKITPPVKACLEDAARALQFIRNHAAEWNIDPDKIAVAGGSAGGFTALWLAFHPDMAAPSSSDPVARQSTRVSCALTFVPQTSLDPRQLKEWIPGFNYGHHAFSLPSFQAFLDKREELLPYIHEYSPYELATSDDPPVYLFYDSEIAMGSTPPDAVHSANLGAGLAEKLKTQNIPYEFSYKGADTPAPDMLSFLRRYLLKNTAGPSSTPSGTEFSISGITSRPNALETGFASQMIRGDNASDPVMMATFEGNQQFPFIKFIGPWDLSGYEGVQAEVTNKGEEPVNIVFRVDNNSDVVGSQDYNSESVTIQPGETRAITVKFGQSYGSPGYPLDPAHVASVSCVAMSPTKDAPMEIRQLEPIGSKKKPQ